MTKPQQTSWPQRARRWALGLVLLLLLCAGSGHLMFSMPGSSYQGPLPPTTPAQHSLAQDLRRAVKRLATTIGARNTRHYKNLLMSQAYIELELKRLGYKVRRVGFQMREPGARFHNNWVYNIEVQRPGTSLADEIVLIGAHYDTAHESPGANDNGSGVAALLALARHFHKYKPKRTLRFVAFVNEEPPYFRTSRMGSLNYARRSEARKEKIVAMLSLETIGYFSDKPGSQRYPPPLGQLYPAEGNFIGFVGNVASRALVRKALKVFRKHAQIPSEGAATFAILPGIGWSDHWAFWQAGYPAIMVTDTAPYRYPHYHKRSDTPDKLDYRRMALVVEGLQEVVKALSNEAH